MAQLWADNPDYYTDDQVYMEWTNWASATQYIRVISNGGRRSGTNALGWTRTAGRSGSGSVTKVLSPGDNKIAFCFGLKFTYFAQIGLAAGKAFIGIGDGTTIHISIVQNDDKTLGFYKGRELGLNYGGTYIGSTSWAPTLGHYAHVSIQAVIHDSTGSLSCKINGSETLNGGSGFTNIDTQNGGTAAWTRIIFYTVDHSSLPEPAYQFCDIVVNDGTGSTNNTHPGDISVLVNVANTGNGNNTGFTPSSGGDHGAMVDDNPLDSDTSYNQSTATGQRDTYVFSNLALSSGTVTSVINRMALKKTESGTCTAVGVVYDISAATNYDGAVTLAPSEASYEYFDDLRETDPNTSSAWSIAGVNDKELGVKRAT